MLANAAAYCLRATTRFPLAVIDEVPAAVLVIGLLYQAEKRRQCGTPSMMMESLIGNRSKFLGSLVRYVANTLG